MIFNQYNWDGSGKRERGMGAWRMRVGDGGVENKGEEWGNGE